MISAPGFNELVCYWLLRFGAFTAGRLADVYGRKTLATGDCCSLFYLSVLGVRLSAGSSREFIVYRVIGGLRRLARRGPWRRLY